MNNNNGSAKNDSGWLTALDFVKDVKGSPTHLTFYIYQKNAFLHDFGNYWVLYIELSGDFRQVPTDTFIKLCNILAVSKEYKQMGIFLSNNKWYICQIFNKGNNHRTNMSKTIMQHTLASLLDRHFNKLEQSSSSDTTLSPTHLFSDIGRIV
uniref:SepD n=1 Tax=Citrobacter rodentium TaxID=67825 RepID=Q93FL3_CITRO|nr:SepD [Citrobacter rodentium]